MNMCALSNAIREKPNWVIKSKNLVIVAKWKEEVKEQQKNLAEYWRLSDGMVRFHNYLDSSYPEKCPQVDYVMAELKGYASLKDTSTGIEVSRLATP